MSVTATIAMALSVAETMETGVPDITTPTVTHDAFNVTASLNSGSTPPATTVNGFEKALAAGAGTIDLTAIPGTGGATFDRTGLKLQAALITNTGAAAITISSNVANGYDFLGADFSIVLGPDESFQWTGADNATVPDIDATHKIIDLTGTGTDTLNVLMVFG